MVNKKRCFVIMPFSRTEHHADEYWTRHFELYLKPLIEKFDELEVFRSEPLRGDISSQIITNLVNSDIVIADLTDHNPNVFWELGVRQSYKYCTITIAEIGTQIPFHFSHKGILFYHGEHLGNQDFEDRFLACLKDCVENPKEPDSPVLEAMGGRGTLYSIIHNEENIRKVTALKMEINSNEGIINRVYDACSKNSALRSEKKDNECTMPSALLTVSSTEFLYVNRYLDLDEEFYDAVLGYYKVVETVNKHLVEWVNNNLANEEWIISMREIVKEYFDKIKGYLEKLKL